MKTHTMTPDTLAHHLDMAAKRYDEWVTACRDPAAVPAAQSLYPQFERQAKECREFAAALRNPEDIRYNAARDRFEVDTEAGL